jgi:hypothetical protein
LAGVLALAGLSAGLLAGLLAVLLARLLAGQVGLNFFEKSRLLRPQSWKHYSKDFVFFKNQQFFSRQFFCSIKIDGPLLTFDNDSIF